MVATPFPIKFVMALASDMNLSTPNNRANPSTGITLIAVRVVARTRKPLPVTRRPVGTRQSGFHHAHGAAERQQKENADHQSAINAGIPSRQIPVFVPVF